MLHPATLGVVLAGGRSRRMGQDKSRLCLGGRSLLDRVVSRFAPQVVGWILSASQDRAALPDEKLQSSPMAIVPDGLAGHQGPLAGILASLDHLAANYSSVEWLATVPCDTPFLPQDLVTRLHDARLASNTAGAVAVSGGRKHPVAALWLVSAREALHDLLHAGRHRTLLVAVEQLNFAEALWPSEPYDPFFNVNTPQDLESGAAILQRWPEA